MAGEKFYLNNCKYRLGTIETIIFLLDPEIKRIYEYNNSLVLKFSPTMMSQTAIVCERMFSFKMLIHRRLKS